MDEKQIKYIVRRLTPTECARLQGMPDDWCNIDTFEDMTDEQYEFWRNVRETYDEISGRRKKTYTKAQILRWRNGLRTDAAEYKAYGNGLALPCAEYVMTGIVETEDD